VLKFIKVEDHSRIYSLQKLGCRLMDLSVMHLRRTNGCLIKGSNSKLHMQSINDGGKMYEWKKKVPSS
jgi:hypothetical protein